MPYHEIQKMTRNSRLNDEKRFVQHGSTSVYKHSVRVTYASLHLARLLHIRVNKKELIHGAMLHDYFLYDWHDADNGRRLHGFTHPFEASKNARRDFPRLTKRERDIIEKHMFPFTPFPPRYRESVLVCLADKFCSLEETIFRK